MSRACEASANNRQVFTLLRLAGSGGTETRGVEHSDNLNARERAL